MANRIIQKECNLADLEKMIAGLKDDPASQSRDLILLKLQAAAEILRVSNDPDLVAGIEIEIEGRNAP